MTNPKAATTTKDGRFYSWRDERFWSVTTITNGGAPKGDALVNWAKKFTAEYACNNIVKLNALLEPDHNGNVDIAGAVDWLKGAAFRDRDAKADYGTAIHEAVEAYTLGKPYPPWDDAVKSAMREFVAFLSDYKPEFIATECSVFNRTERYAGTLDAIARMNDRLYLLDYKTGKGVYPEVALQLAAYRYAEFIGMPDGSESELPSVNACVVVHLPLDGRAYDVINVRADDEIFQTFLFVRECFRWTKETSKGVILGTLPSSVAPGVQASIPLADELGQ